MFESKAPGIDQRCDGDVEGAIGLGRNLHSHLIDFEEHLSGFRLGDIMLAFIDVRDDAVLVEHGECLVHFLHLGNQLLLEVFVVLVGDVIYGAEDGARTLLIGHILLLADDEYGADNEQRQEW